jgi:hypothetical protein
MVHSTVEDIIASFPHPILPTVQGEPDYHTIHSIRKLLRANARSVESHLGGGYSRSPRYQCISVSIATYATVAPAHQCMVGFANTTARYMIDHLFLSYGSITNVDLEHNWENMRKSWDPQ